MKWVIVFALLAALVLAVPILLRDARRGARRGTAAQRTRGLSASLLPGIGSLVVIALAVYAGHEAGIFSVPLVALAFVPFGLVVRWLLIETQAGRREREIVAPALTRRQRIGRLAFWPLFVVMVLAVAVVAAFAGMLAAQR